MVCGAVVASGFMAAIDLDTHVVRSPEPIWADTGAGLVMLSLAAGKYFGLNETAEAVWQAMEKPVTVRALSDTLISAYDVDRDRAASAVIAIVSRMIDERIASAAN